MSLPINWERMDIDAGRGGKGRKREGTVWLSTTGKANKYKLNKINISADLCKELNLKNLDTIWLYKSGDTFMIRKEPSDFIVYGDEGGSMTLTNRNFVAKILAEIGNFDLKMGDPHTEFEAIVIDGGVVFQV